MTYDTDKPASPEGDTGETSNGAAGTLRGTKITMLVFLVLGVAGGIWLARHQHAVAGEHRRAEVAREAQRLAAARVAPPQGLPDSPFVSPMPRFRPRLRDVPPVRVTGAAYPRREPVGSKDVVTDLGLPFAFRLRGEWGCDISGDMPDATARHCEPSGKGGPVRGGPRLRVIVRVCPGGCGAGTRARLTTDWLGHWSYQVPPWKVLPKPAKVLDGSTSYVDKRSASTYVLVMSHFFTGPHGVRYHVGAAVDGPQASAAALQRIINDIRTQAS